MPLGCSVFNNLLGLWRHATLQVTADLLDHFKINVVVHGKTPIIESDGINPYQVAIDRGILVRLESKSDMTAGTLTARIIANAQSYADRNKKKIAKELRVIAAQEKRDAEEAGAAAKL
jgi:ethanolamine-phosphate cytidylyltransferase